MRYVIAVIALLVCACEPRVDPQSGKVEVEALPASQEVTIYSGRSEALVAPLFKKFEESSGIKVNVKYGDSGELAGTLIEEGAKSPADIFWAQDAGTLGVLAEKDLLAPLPNTLLDKVSPVFRPPGEITEWVPTSGRARVLAYSTKIAPEDLPKSIKDLADARWKGRIGWAPENASFQAFVAAMIQLEGAEAAQSWLQSIVENQPRAYPRNSPAVAAVASGEVDIALVNHYYLLRHKAEHGADYPVENHYFRDSTAASLVNVSGIATIASSRRVDAAHKLIAYMLDESAQKYFSAETYEYPVVDSVPPYEGLPTRSALNPPKIDVARLSNLQATIELLRSTNALP